MPLARSLAPDNPVDAAIARVLDAERAARDDIAAANREAVAIAEAARAAVRALELRTERRIQAGRASLAARTASAVAALDAEATQTDEGASAGPDVDERVGRAAARVAAQLTADA